MPEIWCGLPNEILCAIIEQSDRETRLAWSCTNTFFYNFASNLLWRSLHITPKNLEGSWNKVVHKNVFDLQKFDGDKKGMLVPFLSHTSFSLYRQCRKLAHSEDYERAPKLPAQRVKFLSIDFSWDKKDQTREFQNQEVIIHAFGESIGGMSQLQRCHYEGRLFADILEMLLDRKTKSTLRELVLRWKSEYVRCTEHVIISQIPDFRVLAGLGQLRTLSIGRLAPHEARGLAEAVVTLEALEALEVSSAPPADDNDSQRNLFGTTRNESPLLIFLSRVCQLRPMTKTYAGMWGGLPSTLQHLRLKDIYRPVKSKKKRTILDAIGNCKKLRRLELRTMATNQLKIFFRHAELPSLTHLSVSGCRHFLQDNRWMALGLSQDCFAAEASSGSGTIKTFTQFMLRHRYHIIFLRSRYVTSRA
ncbi:MAG: hypothetical protein L6R41_000407 [Letrouitia leprolyta]|nr:MAG: hypothetical protein L6R41_000407 [Letrouitia leprolyta]